MAADQTDWLGGQRRPLAGPSGRLGAEGQVDGGEAAAGFLVLCEARS